MDKPARLGGKNYLVKAIQEENESKQNADKEEAKLDNEAYRREIYKQQRSFMHTHLRYLSNWMICRNDEYDFFKHSYIRYLGYAHEFGEAFRPFISSILVKAAQGISIAYVFCDGHDKYQNGSRVNNSNTLLAADTFLWHGLASFIIPNLIIRSTSSTLMYIVNTKAPFTRYLPTMIALLTIPLIMKPIDRSVDFLLNTSVRHDPYNPTSSQSNKIY